jgi:hypothetical protein
LTAGAREGLFERDSHVVDYWLAHCEGFTLGKRRVTGVVCDQSTGRARTLFVESGLRKSHPLPARAVAAVDPFNKVLYLEKRTQRRSTQTAGVVAMATARHFRALAVAVGRISWRYSKDGAVWLRPRLGSAARTTALLARKGYSEAALWLAPRLAAGLRALVIYTNALLEAVRRRLSAER